MLLYKSNLVIFKVYNTTIEFKIIVKGKVLYFLAKNPAFSSWILVWELIKLD
jgi:hypothetical protein